MALADLPLLRAPLRRLRPASRDEHVPVPRKVQFDWSQTPLDWIPGQPFASTFINQINMMLPAGEFWFCRLYTQALPLVTDARLRSEVEAFIRQEAMHGRAHVQANEQYLRERGLDPSRNQRLMAWLFEGPMADAPFGRRVPARLQRQWLVFRLGLVAAIEHMTCVLGRYALDNQRWEALGADPVLLDLLRWHGAEEIEHRCVAFDLYRALGGGYLSRYYLATVTFPLVFGLWVDGAAHLLAQDARFAPHRPSVWRPWIWLEWQRVAREGLLPSLPWLARREFPYLTPWYHPSTEASTEQALAYLARSPAAAALAQAAHAEAGAPATARGKTARGRKVPGRKPRRDAPRSGAGPSPSRPADR